MYHDPKAVEEITPEYRVLIETANLDWQVGQYHYQLNRLTQHSAAEVIAAAIYTIAKAQHGEAFDKAVAAYR